MAAISRATTTRLCWPTGAVVVALTSLLIGLVSCTRTDATHQTERRSPLGVDGGSAPARQERPRVVSREVYDFDSLANMVATSDAVVIGTTFWAGPGRTIGEGGDALTFTEVHVQVDEVLYGSVVPGEQLVIEIDEPTEYESGRWLSKGVRSIVFLYRKADPTAIPVYSPLNRQSVFLVVDGDVQATIEDPLTAAVAELSVPALRGEVATIVRLIELGKVTPEDPSL